MDRLEILEELWAHWRENGPNHYLSVSGLNCFRKADTDFLRVVDELLRSGLIETTNAFGEEEDLPIAINPMRAKQALAELNDSFRGPVTMQMLKNIRVQKNRHGDPTWDVFISHAWEDKKEIAAPLATALKDSGISVWYDEFTLSVGDSLRRSIDRGLAQSKYGIVIVSPNFLSKEWPQRELDGLVAREIAGTKVILPVWHRIERSLLLRYSPTLADRVATRSELGVQKVVRDLLVAMGRQNG